MSRSLPQLFWRLPDKKTTPSAVCQGTPRPRTIEYVKYAFKDIPGASAIG